MVGTSPCSHVCACVCKNAGVKFFVIATPDADDLDRVLRTVYELYADYVVKNPFYEIDMPIKCDLFEQHLQTFIKNVNR